MKTLLYRTSKILMIIILISTISCKENFQEKKSDFVEMGIKKYDINDFKTQNQKFSTTLRDNIRINYLAEKFRKLRLDNTPLSQNKYEKSIGEEVNKLYEVFNSSESAEIKLGVKKLRSSEKFSSFISYSIPTKISKNQKANEEGNPENIINSTSTPVRTNIQRYREEISRDIKKYQDSLVQNESPSEVE